MTQDRPNAAELVAAVREFLERDVMPATDGRVQFHTRVAVNVLNVVERELKLGPDLAPGERARATALLGHDGDATHWSGSSQPRFGAACSTIVSTRCVRTCARLSERNS